MEYTELLKENEALKLQIADYETRYKPIYEKHLQAIKEQALASYGLQADAVWLNRLTADTEEGVFEQAHKLAVDLRISQRNTHVDPSGKGNFARSTPKQTDLKEVGAKAYQRIKATGRLARTVSTIKIEEPPVKSPQAVQKQGILKRFFGR